MQLFVLVNVVRIFKFLLRSFKCFISIFWFFIFMEIFKEYMKVRLVFEYRNFFKSYIYKYESSRFLEEKKLII